MEDDNLPRMKTVKRMYEDMMTPPTKPSIGHSTKDMDMAKKMFATPKKMAKGGCCRADGIIQRGHTRGRMV